MIFEWQNRFITFSVDVRSFNDAVISIDSGRSAEKPLRLQEIHRENRDNTRYLFLIVGLMFL